MQMFFSIFFFILLVGNMALLEQVKDERKIETKRERRKLLSSGQVSRRGWNIKFLSTLLQEKTVDCNFDT